MQVGATETVTREVRIAARPETIFQFFVDPAKMVCWKGRMASLDARVGGEYRVDINGRDIAGAGKSHSEGWDHYLPRLAVAAAGGDPRPDPWGATTGGGM